MQPEAHFNDHEITMMMQAWGILWLVVFTIPFAIGAYLVAGRMGRTQWLWALLAAIPFVNFFFMIYAFFAVLLYALDRLNQAAPPPPREG